MKKMIQIFAAVIMLLTVTQSFASPGRHRKPTDPAPEFSSNVKVSSKSVKKVGGEIMLIIYVLDVNSRPLAGAQVSAPCTGQSPKITDSKGMALFQLGTTCSCNNDDVVVTTTKGCYVSTKASCGTYTVQCNQ